MSPDNNTKVIEYYRATSGAYERWGGTHRHLHFGFYPNPEYPADHFGSLDELVARLVKFGDIGGGQKVLDAGCGYGSVAIAIANLGEGMEVYGINISSEQLDHAKQRVDFLGLRNVSFFLKDYTNTDFPDKFFERIIMCESLFHASKKDTVFKEVRRILKPGGIVAIADFFGPNRNFDDHFDIGRLEFGWSGKVITIRRVYELLSQCGLRDISNLDISKHVLPSVKMAADSCRDHLRDSYDVPHIILDHRNATIALEDLMIKGDIGYFLLKAERPG